MSETAMEAQKGQRRVSWVEMSRAVCRWIGFVERGSAMMGAVEVEWLRERLHRTAIKYGKICVDDGYGVISGRGTWVSGIVYIVVKGMCGNMLCVELHTIHCVC